MMKSKLIIVITLLIVLSIIGLAGCRSTQPEASNKQISEVKRGALLVTITADGSLDMPREVKLKFGTPGTVKGILVDEGQKVKEGTLLAKLDDTQHKFNIQTAQYNIELAMNELVEKGYPTLMGYPKQYLDAQALLPVEEAQQELEQSQKLLEGQSYQEAAIKLRLALSDLETTYDALTSHDVAEFTQGYDEFLGMEFPRYPEVPEAVKLLERDKKHVMEIQILIQEGIYSQAYTELYTARSDLEETHKLIKSVSGSIRMAPHLTYLIR